MSLDANITPLMKQYLALKNEYQDFVLLFQVGDFYELFFDDARAISSFLAITLTKRGRHLGEDIPLCGIPLHAAPHYITKLVKGGYKVAIADQVSEPKPGSLVERKITRCLTPGTLVDPLLLDEKNPSYLCTFAPVQGEWGLVFTELLTAQSHATSFQEDYRLLEAETSRFFPDEILLPQEQTNGQAGNFLRKKGYVISPLAFPKQESEEVQAYQWLEKSFSHSFKQLKEHPALMTSMSMLYRYLVRYHKEVLEQYHHLHVYKPTSYLMMDPSVHKHLEVTRNTIDGGTRHTLFSVIDHAATPMGSRTLKKWLLRPLVDVQAIQERQEAVLFFHQSPSLIRSCQEILRQITDVERVAGRVALKKAFLYDYCALSRALSLLPSLISCLQPHVLPSLVGALSQRLQGFEQLRDLLTKALVEEPTSSSALKEGYDAQLDKARHLVLNGHTLLANLEKEESEKTGLSTLKLKYTDLYGYAFEVSKTQSSSLPDYFILHQSLSGKNRYVTQKLQQLELSLKEASRNVQLLEQELFDRIKKEVFKHVSSLRHLAQGLCYFDALVSLAQVGLLYRYTMPEVSSTDKKLFIEGGRHPVVERTCPESFVANNTLLDEKEYVWIITGPNMGGKSTYLRQVAHMVLLAHVGSMVPAQKAHVPICDRIFTRIGSGDNVAEGKSTFLVEMEEVASICALATDKSLLILDEVGRGTSTYDGMALAQAIIEYITLRLKAYTLFATHYHELCDMEKTHSQIACYHMAIAKKANSLHFLHALTPGPSASSFGIDAARLSGLPSVITNRAEEISKMHEQSAPLAPAASPHFSLPPTSEEAKLLSHPLLKALETIDPADLTPRQALDLVWRLKELIRS